MNNLDLNTVINFMEKRFPWIDKIDTEVKKVWLASSYKGSEPGTRLDVDVIKLYFNYDNPKYIEKRGNSISGAKFKKEFYDFLKNVLNTDVMEYGSPIDLKFYEVGPKEF